MKTDPSAPFFGSSPAGGPFAGLLWPKLLHAAGLAFRPARIGLGTFALVLVALIDRVPALWNKDGAGALRAWAARVPEQAGRIRSGIEEGRAEAIGAGLGDLFIRTPRGLVGAAPLATILILLLAIPVWGVFALAICRSCATEVAAGDRQPWAAALGFGRSRWLSGVGVILTPWVVIYAAIAILAGLGWVMLNWTGVQVLGGALFVLALPLGTLGVVAMLGLVLGGWMLVPAVACEGSDAIDALQRVYAYVLARPARLLGYMIVVTVAGVLCVGAATIFAHLVSEFTFRAATMWVNEPVAAALRGGAGADAGWSERATVAMVRLWVGLPVLLAAGYAVSYICCAGTMLYLVMRRLCDGQDIGELWHPGMVAGTYAPERPETGDAEE